MEQFDQNQLTSTEDMMQTFAYFLLGPGIQFMKNTTFKVYKVVQRQYSGEVEKLQLCGYKYTQGYKIPIIMKIG